MESEQEDNLKHKVSIDFIIAQYTQYWEVLRMHLRLSWQIPAFAVVAIVALLGSAEKQLTAWQETPLLLASLLLLLDLFVILLIIHHCRNLMFVRSYARALLRLEQTYGDDLKAHHFQVAANLRGWRRISSSSALLVFLVVLALSLSAASLYYFSSGSAKHGTADMTIRPDSVTSTWKQK